MSKGKNNGKEKAPLPAEAEWTPPLKGEDLSLYFRVKEKMDPKSLGALNKRLEKAGKKGAGAELEAFITEKNISLEAEPKKEVERVVDESIKAGHEGVDRVAREGGGHEDVTEARGAAEELVRHTIALAADAGPDGLFVTKSDKERKKENKLKILRLEDVKWFNKEAEKIYGKWAGISIKKLADETGLMKMKAEMTRRIKEIEDIDGTPMSPDDLRVRRVALLDLLKEASLKTESLLNAEKAPVVAETKQKTRPEHVRGEAYSIGLRNGIEKIIDTLENMVYLAPAKENFDEDAFRVYLKDTFAPFRSQGDKIADELSRLDREKDPAIRDEMEKKLIARATEWEKQAAEIQEFLGMGPFNKLAATPEKKTASKERFKNSMAWLKDRGKDLTQKAKDLEIGKQIRAVGERYNKIPRKYKYATSAALVLGGVSAGMVGGSVGAAALGMIGVGRLGYRAIGAAAAFVSIEAKLQQRKEIKEGIFNKHPKAVAAGVAALILFGAPASKFAIEHVGLGEEVRDAAEYVRKHIGEGLEWLSGHMGLGHGLVADTTLEKLPVSGPREMLGQIQPLSPEGGIPDVIHSDDFEQPEWSGGNGIVEVRQGDNLWNILKQQLHESGATDDMTEQQKNYVIDSIQDKLREASEEDLLKMGFSSKDIGVIHAGEKLDLSGILGNKDTMHNILERAGHLGATTPPEGMAVAGTPEVIHSDDFENYSKWEGGQAADHPVAETQNEAPAPRRGSGHGFYGDGVKKDVKIGGFYGNEHPHRVNFGEHGIEDVTDVRSGGSGGLEHGRTVDLGQHGAGKYGIAEAMADSRTVEAANAAEAGDQISRLWEMRHPGESAPSSLIERAQELRAHGIPLENNPLFAEESLSRVEDRLKDIFGPAGSKSGEWNSWKETYSAAEIIKMPRSSFANLNVPKLQDYVRELVEKTGLEPETRGGRTETLGHFIIRAEAGSLNMDLGGGSYINMENAPGLLEELEGEYVPETEDYSHLEHSNLPEPPPPYNGGGSFQGDRPYTRFQADQYPRPKPWPGGFHGNRRWWNPFRRYR